VSSSGQPQRWQALRTLGLAVVVAGVAFAGALLPNGAAQAKERTPSKVLLLELPPEAVRTYRAIRSGGPFPYQKDGSVFGNRERRLPSQSRGFYREYTVKTPGSSDRGARRIVCGGMKPTAPEACYYTADHYTSFSRIVD
jgi:ribonuclease T1